MSDPPVDPDDIHLFVLDPLDGACTVCWFSITNWRHCDTEGRFSEADHQRVTETWAAWRAETRRSTPKTPNKSGPQFLDPETDGPISAKEPPS